MPARAEPAFGGFSLPKDTLRLALFALTVVTVSRVHGFLGLESLRPALLLALLCGVYAMMNPGQLNQGALLRTWPSKVMVGLGILACISVPFGISIGGSGAFILQEYSKVLIYAFLLVVAVRSASDLYFFVWAYVVSAGILSYLSIFVVGVSKTRGVGSYDANDVGLILLIGIPLALVVFQTGRTKREKVASLITLFGIGAALALTSSRGAFVGLLATGLALLLFLRHVSVGKRLAFLGAIVFALMIAAPAGYWEQMETLTSPTEDYNWDATYGRKQVWERGIGYMVSHPLTGIGVDNFGRAEGTLIEHAREWAPGRGRIKWSAAHNSFVQAGAEMGFPGLLLFGTLIIGGMVAMLRLRKRLPSGWVRADPEARFLFYMAQYMPVALVAFAATGFFLSFAYRDPPYILGAFMAGLYASLAVRQRREALAAGRVRPDVGASPTGSAGAGVPAEARVPVGARRRAGTRVHSGAWVPPERNRVRAGR